MGGDGVLKENVEDRRRLKFWGKNKIYLRISFFHIAIWPPGDFLCFPYSMPEDSGCPFF